MHINYINFNKINRFGNYTNLIGPPLKRKALGAFHSTPVQGTSNGMDHFGLIRLEYSRPALRWSTLTGHFGQFERNFLFHLSKLLSPVHLVYILLTRTITERVEAWFRSAQPECTVPFGA